MNKRKIEKIYMALIALLIGIQPVLELVWLNDGTINEIAGFTIPTLIRFGILGIIGILSFFVIQFNRRYIWLIIYVIVVSLYAVLHNFFCLDFQSYVPGDFNYNFFQEIFYIIRLVVPVAMMYFVYNSKIKARLLEKLIIWISVFSSGLVVITNVAKVSLGSYSDKTILGNILDWFLNKGQYAFSDLASKGFFYWSIYSTVLVLIYPYLVYLYFTKKKRRYLGLIALHGIALYMFGTKATTFSVIIELVIMLIVYIVCTLIKKDDKFLFKLIIPYLAIVLAVMLIYPFTPAVSRSSFDSEYKKELDEEYDQKKEVEKLNNSKSIKQYIAENYPYFSINEEFILNSYSYKYDVEFWEKLLNELGPSERMQNRIVEQMMLERVKEINNDPMDTYFGLGYSRTSHIYNLERDFIYQYYSLGLVGVIVFLGPYVCILMLIMFIMLIKFKDRATIQNCAIVLGSGLTLFLAYYSGNVLDNLGIIIMLGAMLGYLLKINFGKNKENTEISDKNLVVGSDD